MSLRFIFGSAGSGKSHFLYEEIIRCSLRNPEERFLLLVPEQYTLAAQAELCRRHPDHIITTVDVLSFNRLAYRVFDRCGVQTPEILSDDGKNLLLRSLASKNEDQLTHLKALLRRPAYVDELKSLLTELVQYDIGPDTFEEMLALPGMSDSFTARGQDILLMYRSFRREMGERYILAEDLLQKLAEVLPRADFLSDTRLYLDGFTGFTPLQKKVLSGLLSLCPEVTAAVTLDPAEDPYTDDGEQALFSMSKKMIRSLGALAEEAGTNVLVPVWIDGRHEGALGAMNGRYAAGGMLSFLESALFRQQPAVYSGPEEEAVLLCRLRDARNELAFAAASIRRLVRKEGIRYRDCAVICADPGAYAPYAAEIFSEYDIPCYVDQKTSLPFHPLLSLVRSLFDLVISDFSAESVSAYLRSGLSALSFEEADLLENYLVASGIRGAARWQNDFVFLPAGISEERLSVINGLRSRVWDTLASFEEAAKGMPSVSEILSALRRYFTEQDIEGRVLDLAGEREAEHDELAASVGRRIFGTVAALLDKTEELLGPERMPAEEHIRLLEAGLAASGMGTIPTAMDTVIIGDLERTRLEDISCLFLLGAGSHAIPAVSASGGLLTQQDRRRLAEADYPLAPDERERAFMQRFYLYLALTKPSRKLILTSPATDGQGKEVAPSYLMTHLTALFPSLEIGYVPASDPVFLEAKKPLKAAVAARIGSTLEEETPSGELASYYRLIPEEEDPGRLLDAAFSQRAPDTVPHAAFSGRILISSVTRLEAFARCPYAYFSRYELGLTEPAQPMLAPLDLGNFYHAALESFGRQLESHQLLWNEISNAQRDQLLETAIGQTILAMDRPQLLEGRRGAFALSRMKQVLSRSVWALTEQLKGGAFIPAAYEQTFGEEQAMTITLAGGGIMRFTGKIDRMDLFNQPGRTYVRIMDYKTGDNRFSYSKLYWGRQLQLPMYLGAARERLLAEGREQVLPGGLAYFRVFDPMLSESAAARPFGLLREMRPQGLYNSNEEVLRAVDPTPFLTEGGDSNLARFKKNKGEGFSVYSQIASPEELSAVLEQASSRASSIGGLIADGVRQALPFREKKRTGCTYCPYAGVCGFDPRLEGYRYFEQDSMDRTQWLERTKTQADPFAKLHAGTTGGGQR